MGTLNAVAIKLEINNSFRAAKPFINKVLDANPVELPTRWGLFDLTELELVYHDDYLFLGVTPVFNPPATEEILMNDFSLFVQ